MNPYPDRVTYRNGLSTTHRSSGALSLNATGCYTTHDLNREIINAGMPHAGNPNPAAPLDYHPDFIYRETYNYDSGIKEISWEQING